MKTLYYLPIIACLLFGITACNKVSLKSIKNSSAIDTNVNVYVAGYITEKGNQSAAYWKNGQLVMLGDTNSFTLAKGIAVIGSDVYVVGVLYGSPKNPSVYEQAVYWKNGVEVALSPDSAASEASCIAVSGNDVYIGGYIHDITLQNSNETQYGNEPIYWKNGAPAKLSGAQSINSIFASGSDVYFAGSSNASNNIASAAYWKNGGQPVLLNYPNAQVAFYGSVATSIAVAGSNIYVAGGTSQYPPEAWTNGNPAFLPTAKTFNSVSGIASNGTNVYVVGSALFNGIDQSATIWKNNVPIPLPLGNFAAGASSMASAVAVSGSNVYAAGTAFQNGGSSSAAIYWKNGVPVQLDNGGNLGATATAIAIANQ